MANDDIDGIFKDFEYKVAGKKDAPKDFSAKSAPKSLSEDEYDEDERLEEKRQKEKRALEKRRKETLADKMRRGAISPEKNFFKNSKNIERFAYIGVILVLAAYIAIDLSFYHGAKAAEAGTDKPITAAAVKEGNKTNETRKVKEESVNETQKLKKEAAANESSEGQKETIANETNETAAEAGDGLSGKITLSIGSISSGFVEGSNDTGYIDKIVFIIENGKDKALTPLVTAYAYDSEMDNSWETRSRGQYKGNAIEPSSKQTASINLVPKTFRNLKLEKTIRLTLNDTKEGFITAVNKKVIIS